MSSVSRIQTPIWSQTCSIGFISELLARQSMTPTSCCARKACVTCCVERGIVLDTDKVLAKTPRHTKKHTITQKPDVLLAVDGSIQHHQFIFLLCRMASHIMTEGPRLPSVGWMHAFISLPPCLRRTRARPSLRNRVKRESSQKTQCFQCLQCPRSHLQCVLPHTRQRRLSSKVNLGHLAGRLD